VLRKIIWSGFTVAGFCLPKNSEFFSGLHFEKTQYDCLKKNPSLFWGVDLVSDEGND